MKRIVDIATKWAVQEKPAIKNARKKGLSREVVDLRNKQSKQTQKIVEILEDFNRRLDELSGRSTDVRHQIPEKGYLYVQLATIRNPEVIKFTTRHLINLATVLFFAICPIIYIPTRLCTSRTSYILVGHAAKMVKYLQHKRTTIYHAVVLTTKDAQTRLWWRRSLNT